MSAAPNKNTLISTSQLMKRWKCSATCIYVRAVKQNWRVVKVGRARNYYLSDIIEAEAKNPVRKYSRKRAKTAKPSVETFEHCQNEAYVLRTGNQDKQANPLLRILLTLKRLIFGK
jgi:hypothetical protein